MKVKYQGTKYQGSSINSPLYKILTKLESKQRISVPKLEWLLKQDIFETAEIFQQQESEKYAQFAELKEKYQVIQHSYLSLSSPLYPILQNIDAKNNLSDSEISWLEQQGLSETIAIAQELGQTREFAALKVKYKATEYQDSTPKSHLYKIIRRLELSNHLGEQALKLTNLDLSQIRQRNLKSAILVTRGAAFRDIDNLADAENCAKKAMEYHLDSYQPYTLMGTICYDRGDYLKGDYWFQQAIQRGAETEDIDAEIKRVIRSTKDENKRHEAAEYLLKKDLQRYSWAKSYLKKS
ncbi:hypothetical protein [Nostoc sp.]|uniref:hypothetical protein n=1 Tax=Nostoc sp. TaxID=1180 RepID=UPI002FFB227B